MIKIGICYWSFVIFYMAWIVWYLLELPYEYNKHGKNKDRDQDQYWDQVTTIGLSGFLFSCVPILMLYLIHFYSYSSVSNLFKGAIVRRPSRQQTDESQDSYHNPPKVNISSHNVTQVEAMLPVDLLLSNKKSEMSEDKKSSLVQTSSENNQSSGPSLKRSQQD